MRKCVSCKAAIASDVNFCPRCGASQTSGLIDSEADTLKLKDQGDQSVPDTVRMTPPTVPITTAIQPPKRNLRNAFIGTGIFLVSLMIGAGAMLKFRPFNAGGDQTSVKTPAQTSQPPNGKDGSKPSVVIVTSNEDKGDSLAQTAEDVAEKSDQIAKQEQERAQKQLELTKKELEKAQKELDEKAARLKEPQSPAIPSPPLPSSPNPSSKAPFPGSGNIPDEDSYDASDGAGRGHIAIRFKVDGDAIVKVRRGEVSVLPLSGSTVSQVTRLVGQPLPAEPCRVTVRQKPFTGASAIVIEEPNARNDFTATIRVRSLNQMRENVAAFAIIWRAF